MKAFPVIVLAAVLGIVVALGAAVSTAEAGHRPPDGPAAPTAAASLSGNRGEAARAAALTAPSILSPTFPRRGAGSRPAIGLAQAAAPDAGAAPRAAKAAHQAAALGDEPSRTGDGPDRDPVAAGETEAGKEPPTVPSPTEAPEGAPAPAPTPAPEGAPPASSPRTLYIGGAAIPYRDVRGGTTPDGGAGLWLGSDDTADGSWGYFVGHNPGPFAPVKSLGCGSTVTLCDAAGATRTYTVRDVFTVETTATWKTIARRVTGYGESLVLQTCTGDGVTNTIVVAA